VVEIGRPAKLDLYPRPLIVSGGSFCAQRLEAQMHLDALQFHRPIGELL
jgi:hypothetical protein